MPDVAGPRHDGDTSDATTGTPSRQVLAVVPTLDVRSRRLERLLASLDRIEGDVPLRTLVVVNRGAELPVLSSAQPLPDPPSGTTVVETGLNLGFAGSIVFGATLAEFSHLWLLQDDLVVAPSCLSELIGALDRHPALGAVNPTRIGHDGSVIRGNAGGLLDADGRIATFLPRSRVDPERYVPDADPDFLMSRGMLVRASAWWAVGGLDARFFPVGWSDVDLCTRLRAAGWSLATVATATVRHEKGASTPRALSAVTYDRNGALFAAKRSGSPARPEVHPAIPRELLEVVAQSAGSLALDLSRRANPRSATRLLVDVLGRLVRRVVGR